LNNIANSLSILLGILHFLEIFPIQVSMTKGWPRANDPTTSFLGDDSERYSGPIFFEVQVGKDPVTLFENVMISLIFNLMPWVI